MRGPEPWILGRVTAGHPHPEGAEPFPREAAAALVGEELVRRARRELAQAWLLAAGIALLALAFPTTGLYGQVLELVARTEQGLLSSTSLVASALALGLQASTPLGPEPAWFVLSALAFGASAVPLLALARERGWERAPALFAVLLALASPVALVAGTLPDAASFQLLGAALLVRGLAAERSSGAAQARAWVLAVLLHASLVWTWPALVAAQLLRTPAEPQPLRRLLAPLCALTLLAGFVLALHALLPLAGELGAAARSWKRDLLAGGDGGPGPLLAWWTLWPLGLGASGLGLAAFAVQLARERAWRRELALVLFALGPWCGLSLGGALDWELPWLWLVPCGVLGLLELLQLAEERAHGARARLAALPLALLGLLGALWIRGLDAQADWTAQASARLEPGDVVLSASAPHRHLLRHRFRVETVDLRPIAARPPAERQRFWSAQVARAAELRGAGRRLVLDEDSLHTFGTPAWPAEPELAAFRAAAQPVRLPELRTD